MSVMAIDSNIDATARNDNIVLTGWGNESVASELHDFGLLRLETNGAKARIKTSGGESRIVIGILLTIVNERASEFWVVHNAHEFSCVRVLSDS